MSRCVIVPHPPHVWILKSGCDVQLAPTNPPTGYSSLGARPTPHVPQWYRSRWYQFRAFVWRCGAAYTLRVGCVLYLAGPSRAPFRHDSRVCVRGLTRTRHKVLLRRCMCARPNTHVPMGYTSLVSLYVDAVCGYGVQVLPCGVCCVLYLAGSPVGPLSKACHNGGCRMLILMISIAISACSVNTWSLILTSPWSRSTGTP